MKLTSYLIPILIKTYLPCFYGSEIIATCEKLSSGFFHTDWFMEDRHYNSMSIVFMEVSKRPIKMSAVGVFEINLGTFLRICNSAYSLFAVFQRA